MRDRPHPCPPGASSPPSSFSGLGTGESVSSESQENSLIDIKALAELYATRRLVLLVSIAARPIFVVLLGSLPVLAVSSDDDGASLTKGAS